MEENVTLFDEALKKQVYLEAIRLRASGLDYETILARLDKQGIPEDLAEQVIKNLLIQQQNDFKKEQEPIFNIALLRIGVGVVLALITAIAVPGIIILPIGLIVTGIAWAYQAKAKK